MRGALERNAGATMIETNTRAAWIMAGTSRCTPNRVKRANPCRLVLLGAPGVGKGTQAELLCGKLGACHLSTGDIFRAAKALDATERSPALTSALDFMRRGELVPDETVLEIVSERVGCLCCRAGHLFGLDPRGAPAALQGPAAAGA